MILLSVYIHIPFCRHRCNYCDFNTYAGLEHLLPVYVRALCCEIAWAAQTANERMQVHTVYFGGGTPSLLSIEHLEQILKSVTDGFELTPTAEITLEANPGTLTLSQLCQMRTFGINRLSLGMQSAHTRELHLLERQHTYLDVLNAVRWARRAGFDQINLDLIYGLPDQTLEDWKHNLEWALRLQPEHLSLYALTLEHGTPLSHWVEKGLVSSPEEDLAADMYEWAEERLAREGYESYEISNWARCNAEGALLACRHNLQYWRNLPYLGFGAGAHGYARGIRTANVRSPHAYIRRCLSPSINYREEQRHWEFPKTPATAQARRNSRQDEMAEMMIMGLRLTQEGISASDFEQRFGCTLEQAYGKEIKELVELGLLEWAQVERIESPSHRCQEGNYQSRSSSSREGSPLQPSQASGAVERVLRLTRRGRLLGNQVFMRFV